MKLRTGLVLILAQLLIPFTALGGPEEDLKAVTRLLKGCTNELPLWKVIERVVVNWQNGEVGDELELYLRRGMKVPPEQPAADLADQGNIARLMAEQGYNYLVLKNLRTFLKDQRFDYVAYEGTLEGKEPAGIPPYSAVVAPEGMSTTFGRELILTYDSRIYNTIRQTRSMVEQVVHSADDPDQPLGEKMAAWIFLRYRSIVGILETAHALEAVLNQMQGLISSLDVKHARHQQDVVKAPAYLKIKDELMEEKERFVTRVTQALEDAKNPGSQRSYWKRLNAAFAKHKLLAPELRAYFFDAAAKYIAQIDKVDGVTGHENKYADDTPAELESQRVAHIKKFEALVEAWNKVASVTYFSRNDTWIYEHYHSEQKMPYVLVSRGTRSEKVYFERIAPILQEGRPIEFLIQSAHYITHEKWDVAKIQERRAQLEEMQSAHERHVRGGTIQDHDDPKHFAKRNKVIADFFALAIESTHRQEAHSRNGYIGMTFSADLTAKYQATLTSLRLKNRWIVGGQVTAGSGALFGVCTYLLKSGAISF